MGRLIDMLKVFTEEVALISELRYIKKQRDHIAHQSFLLTIRESTDSPLIAAKTSDFTVLNERALVLMEEMTEKWKHLDELLNQVSGASERPDIQHAEQGAAANPYPLRS